jgi:hypothetical protein
MDPNEWEKGMLLALRRHLEKGGATDQHALQCVVVRAAQRIGLKVLKTGSVHLGPSGPTMNGCGWSFDARALMTKVPRLTG